MAGDGRDHYTMGFLLLCKKLHNTCYPRRRRRVCYNWNRHYDKGNYLINVRVVGDMMREFRRTIHFGEQGNGHGERRGTGGLVLPAK